jgi:hypothetical protein
MFTINKKTLGFIIHGSSKPVTKNRLWRNNNTTFLARENCIQVITLQMLQYLKETVTGHAITTLSDIGCSCIDQLRSYLCLVWCQEWHLTVKHKSLRYPEEYIQRPVFQVNSFISLVLRTCHSFSSSWLFVFVHCSGCNEWGDTSMTRSYFWAHLSAQ